MLRNQRNTSLKIHHLKSIQAKQHLGSLDIFSTLVGILRSLMMKVFNDDERTMCSSRDDQ